MPPRYNELAANLAVQFIRTGVKAVIAADWAVNDQASLSFAERFYTGLLSGEPYGEAVRTTRTEVWQRFPDVNIGGAYQWYGDPAYRLRIQPIERARRQPALPRLWRIAHRPGKPEPTHPDAGPRGER